MQVFIANKEQEAMQERLKATTSRFDDHAPLRANAEAIEAARSLIGEAASLGMPQVSYTGLQIYVSMYDTEMGLPEHLRDLSRLGSD
jgi:predicted glycosyltransferase